MLMAVSGHIFMTRPEIGIRGIKKEQMKNTIERVKELTREVDGRIALEEAELLYMLACEGPGQGVIVEIGSFQGFSTIWLASGSRERGREKVYAVDPHCTDLHGNNELIFRGNLKKTGVDDYVIPIVKTSTEAAKDWSMPIRLLYIDGAHDYENAKNDFLLWEKHLINGGIVAFHDCYCIFWPDVGKVVNECIFNSDRFADTGCVNTIIYARKVEELTPLEKSEKDSIMKRLLPRIKAVDNCRQAESMIKSGRYEEAENLLRSCERDMNDYISPEYRLLNLNSIGNGYRRAGNHVKAEQIFGEILNFSSDSNLVHKRYRALLGIADSYEARKMYRDSLEKYDECLLSHPLPNRERFHALMGSGKCYSGLGMYREAEQKYMAALAIEDVPVEERTDAVMQAGKICSQDGRDGEAEKLYTEALSSGLIGNLHRFRLLNRLGNIYFNHGRDKESEQKFREALSLANIPGQDRYHALLGFGKCYILKGDTASARLLYEEALSSEDMTGALKLNIATELVEFCIKQGKFREIEDMCGKVLALKDISDMQKRGFVADIKERIRLISGQQGAVNA
jgi:tetratricopeptide (TPR) repeat protein/predicted O-methyltransferase YrrM